MYYVPIGIQILVCDYDLFSVYAMFIYLYLKLKSTCDIIIFSAHSKNIYFSLRQFRRRVLIAIFNEIFCTEYVNVCLSSHISGKKLPKKYLFNCLGCVRQWVPPDLSGHLNRYGWLANLRASSHKLVDHYLALRNMFENVKEVMKREIKNKTF